ncbi:MAG: PAS domain S-box protein [Deltaproteobacteria bacterium]
MTFLRHQHLVFMPGLDGTGKSFEPLLPLIAADARVTIVRYPTDKRLSFEETVECAAAQIPAGDPPVVIAESFSGPVAVRMIASGRVQARALVLCATFARSPHPVVWRIVRFLRLPFFIRPDMPKPFFSYIMGGDKQVAALLPLWRQVHADVPACVMASRLDLINRIDVTSDLRKLTVPCCYLQATDDRIVPSRCLKDFEHGIPCLSIKKIKAPHFILQAEPQACLTAIDDFLRQSAQIPPGNAIAALRQQIADVQKSESFFRTVTQGSLDIIIVVNVKAVITYINPVVEKFLGYKPEEIIGKNGFDYIAPGDIPRALRDFGKAILTREVIIPNAFGIRHKDGSYRVLEGVGINLLYNPVVKGFVMNVRDITERRRMEDELATSRRHLEEIVEKRTAALSLMNAQLLDELTVRKEMEKALKASEEKYRDFIDSAPIGVAIVDLAGNVQYINKKIEELMGWSRYKIIGRNGFSLGVFDDQSRQLLLERFNARINGAPARISEFPVTAKDGNRIRVEIMTTILKKDGASVGAQMAFVNIEERKRAEEERKALMDRLHQAEKMESLGTMAGGIAHELNNVLGALIGYAELMLMKIPSEDPLKKNLHNIVKSGERATAIIKDMLTLARRGGALSEVVNLNRILSDFFQTPDFKRLASSSPLVTFREELAGDLQPMRGSSVHLRKIIGNLVFSVVEDLGDEGEITISTGHEDLDTPLPGYSEVREGRYVVLKVGNNGQGISPTDLKKIFEPFYMKKVMGRSGTGLELAVVWGTVREHDGYIDVQSEPGKGSVFTVYFPAIKE